MSKIGDLVLELQEQGKLEIEAYNDNSELWIAHEKSLAANDSVIEQSNSGIDGAA
jgi:hypothetical protein